MTDPEGFCSCSLWEEQGAEGKRREGKETEKRHFSESPWAPSPSVLPPQICLGLRRPGRRWIN